MVELNKLYEHVTSFCSMWRSGMNAKMVIEWKAGQAFMNISFNLGCHPEAKADRQHNQESKQKHSSRPSPSRLRRRKKRAQARKEAAVDSTLMPSHKPSIEVKNGCNDNFETKPAENADLSCSLSDSSDQDADQSLFQHVYSRQPQETVRYGNSIVFENTGLLSQWADQCNICGETFDTSMEAFHHQIRTHEDSTLYLKLY